MTYRGDFRVLVAAGENFDVKMWLYVTAILVLRALVALAFVTCSKLHLQAVE